MSKREVVDGHNLPNTEDRSATRRRGAELEDALLSAAWEVLTEQGYAGFSYEAVAARAGTSRPVLYRRWPQRDDLLLATVTRYWRSSPIPLPDTGALREDAIAFLRNADVAHRRMMALVSIQIGDFFNDTGSDFGRLCEAAYAPGDATPFEIIVARAVERGELSDALRSSRVLNLPFVLFRDEAIMTREPVTEEAIIDIIDEVWLPLLLVAP